MTARDLLRAAEVAGVEGIVVAESLTGGLLAAEIVSVPGASAHFWGGIVAYDMRVKHAILGVDQHLLDTAGAVDARVAEQLARGAAYRLAAADKSAELALATTGIAGPASPDGQPVGTVFIAGLFRGQLCVQKFAFDGDRDSIRTQAVEAALDLGKELIDGSIIGDS